MNSIVRKVFTYLLLPAAIVGLTYALVTSVMEPVEFNKHKDYRQDIAVQRLKDIRDLQVAFKNVNGHYTADIDSLKAFYNEGKMKVVMQIGSKDDSVAMANTQALKKRNPRIKPEQMLKLYQELLLKQNLLLEKKLQEVWDVVRILHLVKNLLKKMLKKLKDC